MALIETKCSNCTATLSVEDSIAEKMKCEFCGCEFLLQRSKEEMQAALELHEKRAIMQANVKLAEEQAAIELQKLRTNAELGQAQAAQNQLDLEKMTRANAKKAVASVVMSFVSLGLSLSLFLVFFGVPAALVAFILGFSARKDPRLKTKSRAKFGMACSGAAFVISLAILIWFISSMIGS